MNSRTTIVIIILCGLVLSIICGCNKVPEDVIQPQKMAEIMADMQTAEAVVESNRRYYPGNDQNRALKEAVYLKHGVTGEQVDSSMVWYGHHITEYMKVCDANIEILETRLIENGSHASGSAALSVDGDSVDVWPFPRFLRLGPHDATRTISFNFERDDSWEKGDSYTLRFKSFHHSAPSDWSIVADYEDGSVELLTSNLTGEGWHELTFRTDSADMAIRIYGYLSVDPRNLHDVMLDSVALVRRRLNPEFYSMRYHQRRYNFKK